MYTKAQLWEQLSRAGIAHSDIIMLHSSLRAIGEVEGGADGLIDAVKEYLCDGLLLIPTHTWEEFPAKTTVYDVRTAVPCIGALPRVAAKRPDAVRSLHPSHSVAAFGKGAAAYVRGEEACSTPCPPNGCWGRLADVGAKILLAGVGNNRNTYIHSIDERLNLPDRLSARIYSSTIIASDGTEYHGSYRSHGCTKCPDISANYVSFDDPLTRCGAQTTAQLGDAITRVVDAREALRVIAHIWERADYDLCVQLREIPLEYYRDIVL